MLADDLAGGLGVVEGHGVIRLGDEEPPVGGGVRQAEDRGQERR
jgi:hypothetical protein